MKFQIWTFLLFSCLGSILAQHENDCGPLCDYVRREDPAYKYEYKPADTVRGENCTTYFFNLTSQRWRPDASWMDRPVWWHWFTINIPHDLKYKEQAMIFIGTGNNNAMNSPGVGGRHVRETLRWCQRTGMITAVLRQIPNQPIRFNDTWFYSRNEDAIIAKTWRDYLEMPADSKDPEVVLRMPMTKAVSKSMTALQDILENDPQGTNHPHKGTRIKRFMIAGNSKRGWTAWMMPPVDTRVEVIAPIVLSCLNVNEVFRKYYKSLDGWPVAIGDYWLANIMSYLDDPAAQGLLNLVDPYSHYYRRFLDIPKFMVSGGADEFFMMDDYDFFFDGLPGEKYLWIQENTTHSIDNGPIAEDHWRMLETFYIAHIKGKPRPVYHYHRQVTSNGGSILLHTTETVSKIEGWMADTPDMVYPRRDFRALVLDPILPAYPDVIFSPKPATHLGNGWYEIYYSNPPPGKYRAFFLKMHFPWPEEEREFIFSTQAVYLPDGYPFDGCEGHGIRNGGCRGILR